MSGNREWDAGATQREIDARAYNRIGGIVGGKIGQPITHGVTTVTFFEIHHHTVRVRLAGDVRNGFGAQSRLDDLTHFRGRISKIDIEIHPLAMLAWLACAPAQNHDV